MLNSKEKLISFIFMILYNDIEKNVLYYCQKKNALRTKKNLRKSKKRKQKQEKIAG